MSQIALGDRSAFRQLYDACAPSLLGVALRILNKRDEAEDVVQEVFVSVWKLAGGYEAAASQPMTWLTAIVRNRCLDALRRGNRRPTVALDDDEDHHTEIPDERPDPLGLLEQSINALQLSACMGELPGNQRQCLALAYYHGLSHSEMAERLGSPLGSVKAWIRRGLDRLKRCLATVEAGA
ncbi:MAG TPA: sigma-70 family RNA polymerase sigma factor [Rhodocyclaceae bacterium]|nr:sigma-70 family RNA polymerase sigma factor [Rhodocyclaceae bacterium]